MNQRLKLQVGDHVSTHEGNNMALIFKFLLSMLNNAYAKRVHP